MNTKGDMFLWDTWKLRTKSRLLYFGYFSSILYSQLILFRMITGPSHEQMSAILVNLLMLSGFFS